MGSASEHGRGACLDRTVVHGNERTFMTGLLTAAIAGATSCAITPLMRQLSRRMNALDVPNHRSMHTVPTPRSGGAAILLGILLAVGVAGSWRDRDVALMGVGMLTLAGLAVL